MTAITIDAELREKLLAAGEVVELRDESGLLVAHALVHSSSKEKPRGRLRRYVDTLKSAIVGQSPAAIVGGEPAGVEQIYARFTDRSRKVMSLANQEAQRFNHEYIGTEHMLLGLAQEGAGVGATVLKNLHIDLRKIRLEVEKIVQHGPGGGQVVMGRLPHTPRAKKVIEYSVEEARNLSHNYVGTEHLLLGLLREQEGVAAQVLMNLGLKLEDVREEVLNLLGHRPSA